MTNGSQYSQKGAGFWQRVGQILFFRHGGLQERISFKKRSPERQSELGSNRTDPLSGRKSKKEEEKIS